ncbi:MAG: hypothetical protein H7832_14125 [Magnetococcus sp. DMHC-6]
MDMTELENHTREINSGEGDEMAVSTGMEESIDYNAIDGLYLHETDAMFKPLTGYTPRLSVHDSELLSESEPDEEAEGLSESCGYYAVPVETFGEGVKSLLGDLVTGVRRVTSASSTVRGPQQVLQNSGKISQGALGVVTGVGQIFQGGSNIVLGTLGLVGSSALLLTQSILKNGGSELTSHTDESTS